MHQIIRFFEYIQKNDLLESNKIYLLLGNFFSSVNKRGRTNEQQQQQQKPNRVSLLFKLNYTWQQNEKGENTFFLVYFTLFPFFSNTENVISIYKPN